MKIALAVDGGGMAGVIPARILRTLFGSSSHPMYEVFDLVMGTSTGGLIAAGIGIGMTPAEIENLYYEIGPRVFRKKRRLPWTLWKPEYRARYLREELEKILGKRTMGDALTNIAVTTYRFGKNSWEPSFFKSYAEHEKDVPMVDAMQATAQAPAKHPLHRFRDSQYTDGGVFAVNPAACAYADACRLWPDDDILLISLGTGIKREPEKAQTDAGVIWWGKNGVGVILDGISTVADYHMQSIAERDKRLEYYRFDVFVGSKRMDETDSARLYEMAGIAEAEMRSNSDFMRLKDHLPQIITSKNS